MKPSSTSSLVVLLAFAVTIAIGACRPAPTGSADDPASGSGAQPAPSTAPAPLDPKQIEEAAGGPVTVTGDGVVRLTWSRDDVAVRVDGMAMPPAAGLGSWAAITATPEGAMVMGDTVVFQDEVDAALDAALASGLEATALHNHFFYDEPKVYFLHLGGAGEPARLAAGVKAIWDAIREVRARAPEPAAGYGGPVPEPGEGRIDPAPIESITGHEPTVGAGGVVKVTIGRESEMHGVRFGGSSGLTTWAAFSGADELAAMDGDIAMRADEVTAVLRALRASNLHVVSLHNHMMGEAPPYFFVHFWGVGPTSELAAGFKSALDVLK
jgi:hypothetical protein